MRVLLGCSLGGEGHLAPLASVARALREAGHDPMLLVPPGLEQSARRTGLRYRVGEEPPRALVEAVWQRVREGPAKEVGGLIDRELFASRCTEAMLPAARQVRDEWRPDLIVREPTEYATAVAAHEAGIPQAQVAISLASIEFRVLAMVGPIIDGFAGGVATTITSCPYLSAFPPSLDPSDWPDTRRFRVRATDPGRDGVRGRWGDEGEPLVYMTFGTVLAQLPEARRVYRAALDAVAGVRARALLTVGRTVDPASLGWVPANTRVVQWVPQQAVLEDAALVVCHGGAGTTFGALAAGVPLVICPLFADQPRNAEAVRRAGAGVIVGGREDSAGGLRSLGPEDVAGLRAGIDRVLGDPGYRAAAERVAAEVAGLPALEAVIEQFGAAAGAT